MKDGNKAEKKGSTTNSDEPFSDDQLEVKEPRRFFAPFYLMMLIML